MSSSNWMRVAQLAVPSAVAVSAARSAVDYVPDGALWALGLQRRQSTTAIVVGSLVVGAAAGIAACLFLAPHGEEMREELVERANEMTGRPRRKRATRRDEDRREGARVEMADENAYPDVVAAH